MRVVQELASFYSWYQTYIALTVFIRCAERMACMQAKYTQTKWPMSDVYIQSLDNVLGAKLTL